MELDKLWYEIQGSPEIKLYIPEEDFTNCKSMDDIMKKYNIKNLILQKSSEKTVMVDWLSTLMEELDNKLDMYSELKKYSCSSPQVNNYFNIKNIDKLVDYGKKILKKFLPTEDMINNYQDKNKYHLRYDEQQSRLFSFNYLREIVKDKNLDKIKFPNRAMIIIHNNKILTQNETMNYIDKFFTIQIDNQGYIIPTLSQENYKIIICSDYITRNKIQYEAMKQLRDLCVISPFDTSAGTGGNIFGVGNEAWIVDGKNKKTGAVDDCLKHLHY